MKPEKKLKRALRVIMDLMSDGERLEFHKWGKSKIVIRKIVYPLDKKGREIKNYTKQFSGP
jgi:hypothetical protein